MGNYDGFRYNLNIDYDPKTALGEKGVTKALFAMDELRQMADHYFDHKMNYDGHMNTGFFTFKLGCYLEWKLSPDTLDRFANELLGEAWHRAGDKEQDQERARDYRAKQAHEEAAATAKAATDKAAAAAAAAAATETEAAAATAKAAELNPESDGFCYPASDD